MPLPDTAEKKAGKSLICRSLYAGAACKGRITGSGALWREGGSTLASEGAPEYIRAGAEDLTVLLR